MSTFVEMLTTIAIGFFVVAIASVLVSRNAQTPEVVQSVASGFGNNLAVAISPVTGTRYEPSLGYPSSNSQFHNFGF